MRFNLYLPPTASPELRKAHHAYVAAIEASWTAPSETIERAWALVEETRRRYGQVLLREDKAKRPHVY